MRKSKVWISLFLSSVVTLSLPIPIFADTVTVTTVTTVTTTYYVYPYDYVNTNNYEPETIVNNSNDASLQNLNSETVQDLKEVTINDVMRGATKISGTANPNATVTLAFPDESEVSVKADADGNWTCDVPSNINLSFYDKVYASQSLGNKTSPKSEIIVDTPNTPPEYIPRSSSSHANVENSVEDTTPPSEPFIDPVASSTTKITGTGEPGAVVTINVNDTGGNPLTAKVSQDGTWSITLPAAKKDGDTIIATQKDAAGNTSASYSVTVGNTSTPTPTYKLAVNTVKASDMKITGTGEPGAAITVTFPNKQTAAGTVDSKGNWSINLPANTTLLTTSTVTQKNSAGATESVTAKVPAPSSSNPTPLEKGIMDLLNNTRINGLNEEKATMKALTFDSELYKLAQYRAEQISLEYAHRFNGRAPENIVKDNSYTYLKFGENLAWVTNSTSQNIYDTWYESQDHYENMFDSSYTNFAIATFESSDGRTYAVTLFSKK